MPKGVRKLPPISELSSLDEGENQLPKTDRTTEVDPGEDRPIDSDKIRRIASGVEEDERQEKKTRKRRAKKVVEPDEEQVKAQQTIGFLGKMFYRASVLGIARMPNPIPLSDTESEMWQESCETIAEELMPYFGKFGKLFGVLGVALVITIPRLEKPEEIKGA